MNLMMKVLISVQAVGEDQRVNVTTERGAGGGLSH